MRSAISRVLSQASGSSENRLRNSAAVPTARCAARCERLRGVDLTDMTVGYTGSTPLGPRLCLAEVFVQKLAQPGQPVRGRTKTCCRGLYVIDTRHSALA